MNNKDNNYELIKFEDGDFSLDVKVSPNEGRSQEISYWYGENS